MWELRWIHGHALAAALMLILAWPSHAKTCAPFDPMKDTNTKLTIAATDRAAIESFASSTIKITAERPDLFWDKASGIVTRSDDQMAAEKVLDSCAFSRVISKWRLAAAFEAMSNDRSLRMLISPVGREKYFAHEPIELVVWPPTVDKARYLIVFAINGNGTFEHLFPVSAYGDGAGYVAAGHIIRPLGKKGSNTVFPPFGIDHVIALSSNHPMEGLATRLGQLGALLRLEPGDPGARNDARLICGYDCPLDDYAALVEPIFSEIARVVNEPDGALGIVSYTSARRDAGPDVPTARSWTPSLPDTRALPTQFAPDGAPGKQLARTALVIGNEAYEGKDKLKTPKNDANAIADVFQGQGFALVGDKVWKDLDPSGMKHLKGLLYDYAKRSETVVIYYAGHGVGASQGNYLIPVGAKMRRASDLDRYAMMARALVEAAKDAGHIIFIFDACRANNFLADADDTGAVDPSDGIEPSLASQPGGVRGPARGINRGGGLYGDALPGTLVFYSAHPGGLAFDGVGHSPFAKSLLKHLRAPRLKAQEVFDRVVQDFLDSAKAIAGDCGRDCDGARSYHQVPQPVGSLGTYKFYFEP